MLAWLLKVFEAFPPHFVIVNLKWDDTGQRMSIPVQQARSQQAPPAQQQSRQSKKRRTRVSSTYQIMVARLRLAWSWEGSIGYQCIEVLMPPMLLTGLSAANMWYALRFGVLTQKIHNVVMRLLSLATWGIQVHECDGATANDKLSAHWWDMARSRRDCAGGGDGEVVDALYCKMVCKLHAANIVQIAIFASIGLRFINKMYTIALLFRMGGVFTRLHSACCLLTKPDIQIRDSDEPDPGAKAYAVEVLDYYIANYKRFSARALGRGDCMGQRWQAAAAAAAPADSGHDSEGRGAGVEEAGVGSDAEEHDHGIGLGIPGSGTTVRDILTSGEIPRCVDLKGAKEELIENALEYLSIFNTPWWEASHKLSRRAVRR